MPSLDLRDEVAGLPLSLDDIPSLSTLERNLALETWRGRMVNEHISAQVFAGLVPQLMRAGLPNRYLVKVAKMIEDELRHAVLCGAAVHALGEAPVAELPEIAKMPDHEEVDPLEAVLRNVLSISCMSETVAVALINGERLDLGESSLSGLLRQILADEVQHARFGWKLLEEQAPSFDDELRSRLSDYLRVAFAHLERHELANLSDRPAPSEAAAAAGVCDGCNARQIFYDTVEQIIVPRLEEHGFAASRAWAERHRAQDRAIA